MNKCYGIKYEVNKLKFSTKTFKKILQILQRQVVMLQYIYVFATITELNMASWGFSVHLYQSYAWKMYFEQNSRIK